MKISLFKKETKSSNHVFLFYIILSLLVFGPFPLTNTLSNRLFPVPVFPVGITPVWISIGDLNLDGNQDLAVANNVSDDISILFGNGDGTFQSGTVTPVGMKPVSLAMNDFNQDGFLDLAVVQHFSQEVAILLNNGIGNFSTVGTFGVGVNPGDITFGDFNNDGKSDLAVSNGNSNDVSVLIGNGDGSYQTENRFSVGDLPLALSVGDFNGDQKQDLAVANRLSDTVSVLFGSGDGTFGVPISINTGLFPVSILVEDFNGDGNDDFATANFLSNDISIHLGNGSGTFSPINNFGVGRGPAFIQSGDFNSDGILDLSTVNTCEEQSCFQGDITVIFGVGDGSFQQPEVHFQGPAECPNHLAVGDFNNDSELDFAAASFSMDDVVILLGNGNGGFDSHPRLPVGTVPRKISIADFNNDKIEDIGVINSGFDVPGDISILLSIGDETFLPEIPTPAGDEPSGFSNGDFNSDGFVDLAVTDPGFFPGTGPGDLLILLGDGTGTFGFLPAIPVNPKPSSITTADFNMDGEDDLAFLDPISNTVKILLGVGDGTFGPEAQFPAGEEPRSIGIGDFNIDGKTDLAVSNSGPSSGIAILLGNRDGTFGPPELFGIGLARRSITVGDFNNDGLEDLAGVIFGETGFISIILGNGDGTFGTNSSFPVGSFPSSLDSADFDGDGNQDLVASNLGSDSVSLLFGKGDGGFEPEIQFRTGGRPFSLGIGDFNGDLRKDISIANQSSDTVSILFNEGTFLPFSTDCQITPSNLNLQSKGTILSIKTILTSLENGEPLDGSLLAPVHISRVSSLSVGDIILQVPNADLGCDDFTEDGIWETIEDRIVLGSGLTILRFNSPSDGQCETRDGNRQDIIALLLDVPNGETANICYTSTYFLDSQPFECCGTVSIVNHGNR